MIQISSFYRFTPLEPARLESLNQELQFLAKRHALRGLCLLGPEGINATCSGSKEGIEELKAFVRRELGTEDFKDSEAERHPFHVFRIKIKDEIVTLGRPGLVPETPRHNHLTPEEWHEALQDPDTIVVDTRNDYEVEIGKFRGAVDLKLKEFREFPEKIESLDRNKRVLIYCTGGIRCEKAIFAMEEKGFKNVHQLEGGILKYLEKFPNGAFEGECFVFDYRVAVDQKLRPTEKYRLCPHCGQPADRRIECAQCSSPAIVCHHCIGHGIDTCTKNCAHHREIGSASKKPQKQETMKRHMN